MSSSIASVTISAIAESRLLLAQSTAARVLSIGNDWSRLRIGMRMAMGDTGADITGTPRLYAGVMSNPAVGLTNGPLGVNTSNFFGGVTVVPTWTRDTNHYHLTNSFAATTKVGNVLSATGEVSTAFKMSHLPSANRYICVLLIDKGTDGDANWSIGSIFKSSAHAVDTPYERLVEAMEASPIEEDLQDRLDAIKSVINLAAGDTHYSGAILATDKVVDEGANGPLNAICLAWDRTAVPFYFSEVLYAKCA